MIHPANLHNTTWKIIRNWLQRTAPAPGEPEPRRGYWRYTKLELVHQLRSNAPRAGGRPFINSLVKELDPDAVTRSSRSGTPGVLEPKDAVFMLPPTRA